MDETRLIHHMQTWMFYEAQKKWHKSPSQICDIFDRYKVLDYIKECYDYLHLSSYDTALEYVEMFLQNKGAILSYV
jgi:hypothetical protein